ncbi:MAG TPA: hypothetical protein VIV60_28470, partial [Polyangiaceae bacterium]
INRGDVSAVNYGANPFTSIQARSTEWLSMAERVSAPVARAAFAELSKRGDLADIDFSEWLRSSRAMGDMPAMDSEMMDLMGTLDDALSKASDLIEGIDKAGLPAEVLKALDLLDSAEEVSDKLMSAMGMPDPDEATDEPAEKSASMSGAGRSSKTPATETRAAGESHTQGDDFARLRAAYLSLDESW